MRNEFAKTCQIARHINQLCDMVHSIYLILIKLKHLPSAMAGYFLEGYIHFFCFGEDKMGYEMLSRIKRRKQR